MRKWFDSFGEFRTYVLEHTEVIEVLDEEELIKDIREHLGPFAASLTWEELIRETMLQYGISRKNAFMLLKEDFDIVEVEEVMVCE